MGLGLGKDSAQASKMSTLIIHIPGRLTGTSRSASLQDFYCANSQVATAPTSHQAPSGTLARHRRTQSRSGRRPRRRRHLRRTNVRRGGACHPLGVRGGNAASLGRSGGKVRRSAQPDETRAICCTQTTLPGRPRCRGTNTRWRHRSGPQHDRAVRCKRRRVVI